ncbi:MAG: UvrD-helicase domain-containing protein [bacterium]|nr:UvrD-helicase domain-containing protein [bacterium]
MVGDPKQSIYRFRGADVRIYKRVARMIEEKGKKLAITRNFRSRPTILSEVNAVFEPVMQGESDDEANYVALEPADGAAPDPRAVELLLPPTSYDCATQNAAQSAAQEAAAIANHIALQKEVNPSFSYSAVAILMRTGTKVAQLQDALSARGIPFISFMNSAFTSRVEIESLVTILSAIANPQHTVATIGTLRSPWFSISDDDIFAHKLAGRSFVYTDAHSAEDLVCAALRELSKWHALSKQAEPSTLIEELLAAFPIDIIYGLKSEGVLRVQNIQTLIELVRRLEQGGVVSLSAIVDRISDMRRLVQSTELEARDDSREAVQLLTLHKAKGLEFKCVYLYNYTEKIRASGEWLLRKSLDNEPHQLGISGSNNFRTRNWDSVDAANKSAESAELQRLLYVGMTRAKDKLILPLGWSRSGKQASIPIALKARYRLDEQGRVGVTDTDAVATISTELARSEFNPLASRHLGEDGDPATYVEKHRTWHANLADRVNTLGVVVSQIDDEEAEVDWSRVRARKIGTYVHAVLEQSAKGISIADAEKLASRGISMNTNEELEAKTIIEQVLQSPLFTVELPAARRIITELPIVEDHDSYVATKFVDLVFETQSGEWILVDYKTDDIPVDAVSDRKEYHRKQLEQYGQMFARIMGKPPKESRVYFLRPNRMVNL